LTVFGERLGNELTRDATLKALTMIALNNNGPQSPLIELKNLSAFLKTFFDLLKKN